MFNSQLELKFVIPFLPEIFEFVTEPLPGDVEGVRIVGDQNDEISKVELALCKLTPNDIKVP